ncbi:hypothetical protein GCM10023238_34660 [Streptomyces heliomycini]
MTARETRNRARAWARDWALGPSDGQDSHPYGADAESGPTRQAATASAGGEHHERPDDEDRRRDQGPGQRLEEHDVEALQRRNADKGQTAVEYLGIIAVVVLIVLAITGTSIGQTILGKINEQIAKVAP